MTQNRYGKGPGLIPGRRLFNIQAAALVDKDVWARTPRTPTMRFGRPSPAISTAFIWRMRAFMKVRPSMNNEKYTELNHLVKRAQEGER